MNMFNEVEKLLKYRFWDKGRERSNRAKGLVDQGRRDPRPRALCPLRHNRIAYSGPPDDAVRAYVCLECHAAACEPELKDRGVDFNLATLELIHEILDLDLQRQVAGRASPLG